MPETHQLTVPAGFAVNVFADKLQFARFMALAPNGDVFLAEPVRGAGMITILRDEDRDGIAESRYTFASGLNRPFGLAFWKNYLYVGNNDSVVRFTYKTGQTTADGPPEKIVDLPPSDAALDQDTANRLKIRSQPDARLQPLDAQRHLQSGRHEDVRDGRLVHECHAGEATRGAPRSTNTTRTAAGTGCSPAGCAIRSGWRYFPGSDVLWTAVNERDHLGDDLVPDFITSVRDGGFYGWPYSYIGQHVDPTVTSPRPDLVAKAIAPDVLLASHSAALGLIFYTGTQFPAEYRNSAFVALHGSINRSKLSGYAVVRVPFRNGKPAGPPQDFLSGFVARDDEDKQAWGRPVGLLQMPDGVAARVGRRRQPRSGESATVRSRRRF